jgi:hypothetical protein
MAWEAPGDKADVPSFVRLPQGDVSADLVRLG